MWNGRAGDILDRRRTKDPFLFCRRIPILCSMAWFCISVPYVNFLLGLLGPTKQQNNSAWDNFHKFYNFGFTMRISWERIKWVLFFGIFAELFVYLVFYNFAACIQIFGLNFMLGCQKREIGMFLGELWVRKMIRVLQGWTLLGIGFF